MHPDVVASTPGTCPRCGMRLVALDPLGPRDYRLDVETEPLAVAAGRPFRLRLAVHDPQTGEIVRQFAVVHDKIYHLFVISQDLEYYAHVHPVRQPDGSFELELTLPRAGYYKILSDFLPVGGTPQIIARPLVTAGFTGNLAASAAHLVPDRVLTKTTAGVTVTLELPRDGLVAGREESFTYHLTDAASGAPVRDLEPYLAAWGHSLIMSEDTLHPVHAHPVELLPENATGGGGPTLTFKGLLPVPGNYRIWTQLKRRGQVFTVVFTVAAASPTGARP